MQKPNVHIITPTQHFYKIKVPHYFRDVEIIHESGILQQGNGWWYSDTFVNPETLRIRHTENYTAEWQITSTQDLDEWQKALMPIETPPPSFATCDEARDWLAEHGKFTRDEYGYLVPFDPVEGVRHSRRVEVDIDGEWVDATLDTNVDTSYEPKFNIATIATFPDALKAHEDTHDYLENYWVLTEAFKNAFATCAEKLDGVDKFYWFHREKSYSVRFGIKGKPDYNAAPPKITGKNKWDVWRQVDEWVESELAKIEQLASANTMNCPTCGAALEIKRLDQRTIDDVMDAVMRHVRTTPDLRGRKRIQQVGIIQRTLRAKLVEIAE